MPATMAPDIAPRQTKHIRVIIGNTDFAKQVNTCEFKKGGGAVQTWQGGTPDAQYVDKAAAEHTLDLGFLSDWEEEESLCNFLWEHDGETAVIEYQPVDAGRVYFEAEITIDAPMPPGKIGSWSESSITMPSTKPVRKFRTP